LRVPSVLAAILRLERVLGIEGVSGELRWRWWREQRRFGVQNLC